MKTTSEKSSTPSPTSAPTSTSTIAPARDHPPTAELRGLRAELRETLGKIDLLLTQAERAQPAPGLPLSAADCRQLDDLLGLGATRSGPDLVRAVERLASLRFGDIRIPFTPGQLSEIQHRAEKRGRTVQAEMQAVVDRLQDELFYKGG
jgi:hypothetical protein